MFVKVYILVLSILLCKQQIYLFIYVSKVYVGKLSYWAEALS